MDQPTSTILCPLHRGNRVSSLQPCGHAWPMPYQESVRDEADRARLRLRGWVTLHEYSTDSEYVDWRRYHMQTFWHYIYKPELRMDDPGLLQEWYDLITTIRKHLSEAHSEFFIKGNEPFPKWLRREEPDLPGTP